MTVEGTKPVPWGGIFESPHLKFPREASLLCSSINTHIYTSITDDDRESWCTFDWLINYFLLINYIVTLQYNLPGVFTISYKAKWLIAGCCFINSDIGWPIPPAAPRTATFCWCYKSKTSFKRDRFPLEERPYELMGGRHKLHIGLALFLIANNT